MGSFLAAIGALIWVFVDIYDIANRGINDGSGARGGRIDAAASQQ